MELALIIGTAIILLGLFGKGVERVGHAVSSAAAIQEQKGNDGNLTVSCYSPNAKVKYAYPIVDGYSIYIMNEAVNDYRSIETDTPEALKLVAEEVFHYWARIEETGNWDFTNIDHKEHTEDLDMMFDVIGSKPLGNSAWSEARKLKVGDKLLLIYDTSDIENIGAIKVLTESGIHIGYVEKDMQDGVGTFYQMGYAWVDEIDTDGRIPRISAVTYQDELFEPDHSEWLCVNNC